MNAGVKMGSKTKEHYIREIHSHFPSIAFDNARLITKGWDNDVIILDDKLVFRFPKNEEYQSRFRAEVRLLKYLAPKMPVSIPAYTYMPKDLRFGGYNMILGTEMCLDIFNALTQEKKEQISKQLGAFLSAMHKTPVKTAEEFGIKEEKSGYCWSKNRTEAKLNALRKRVFPRLGTKEVDWIEHQFKQYLSLSFDFQITVVHSDFVGDHIFIDLDQGAVTGIIDFADTELADPALDFSGMWHYGESFVEQVFRNYTGNVDGDFLNRSKFPHLVYMVGNMLELEEGSMLPVTFEQSYEKLKAAMMSSLTL